MARDKAENWSRSILDDGTSNGAERRQFLSVTDTARQS